MTAEATAEGPVRLLVFRCVELNASIPLKQCITNWTNANTDVQAERGSYKPLSTHCCIRCPIGSEHAETGKFKSGLRTFSLAPAPNSAKPHTAIPAAPRPAVAEPRPALPKKEPVVTTPASLPRPFADKIYEQDISRLASLAAAARDKSTNGKPDYGAFKDQALAVLRKNPSFAPSKIARDIGIPMATLIRWGRGAGVVPEKTRKVGAGKYSKIARIEDRTPKSEANDVPPSTPALLDLRNLVAGSPQAHVFPLRIDGTAARVHLPQDFNQSDCSRLCAFLSALAWPDSALLTELTKEPP